MSLFEDDGTIPQATGAALGAGLIGGFLATCEMAWADAPVSKGKMGSHLRGQLRYIGTHTAYAGAVGATYVVSLNTLRGMRGESSTTTAMAGGIAGAAASLPMRSLPKTFGMAAAFAVACFLGQTVDFKLLNEPGAPREPWLQPQDRAYKKVPLKPEQLPDTPENGWVRTADTA